ncbi:MAG: glycerophosphodiester phosphodiesterase [Syntrophaceae bacterium]|nr:glycerophosphodiester phosphodiesterase [Syntrophaceae bacterium]
MPREDAVTSLAELPRGRLFRFAHRGASARAPENTLAAVEQALALGADGVEIDVYAVESELVVIHDPRLERTTNGQGRVMASPLAYLRSLDAGQGQRIPFLHEVLDLVDRRAVVNVELKGPGTAGPAAAVVRRYVRERGWRYGDVLLSSFHRRELAVAGEEAPRIPRGLLTRSPILPTKRFQVERNLFSIHIRLDRVSRRLTDAAHRRGLKVFVYTVNREEDFRAMEAMGVDGVFTDFPVSVKG